MTKLTLRAATRLAFLVMSGILMASLAYVVFPRAGVSGLAAPYAGTISGTVFDDYNGNGAKDTGEPGLPVPPSRQRTTWGTPRRR